MFMNGDPQIPPRHGARCQSLDYGRHGELIFQNQFVRSAVRIAAVRHEMISTGSSINQFNIAVPEHVRETFGEEHPDIVGGVNPQGHQNGRSVSCPLPFSVRHEVTPSHVQVVDRRDVAGRHRCETRSQINLQKIISILRA